MLAAFDSESLVYGQTAVLREVSFVLAPGERVVLLGRSGAGKTTLSNAVYDRLVTGGRRVALVPQDHALVPQLSVAKNALMGRLDDHGPLYNLSNLIRIRAGDRSEVGKVLTEVGLSPLADRPVEALSGGQKQRTALARAFYRGGEVLIADEPVSAVDETQAADLLGRIVERFPTMLMALHDVNLARRFATRLVGLKGGRIVLDATPDQVSEDDLAKLYAD